MPTSIRATATKPTSIRATATKPTSIRATATKKTPGKRGPKPKPPELRKERITIALSKAAIASLRQWQRQLELAAGPIIEALITDAATMAAQKPHITSVRPPSLLGQLPKKNRNRRRTN